MYVAAEAQSYERSRAEHPNALQRGLNAIDHGYVFYTARLIVVRSIARRTRRRRLHDRPIHAATDDYANELGRLAADQSDTAATAKLVVAVRYCRVHVNCRVGVTVA